MPVLHLPIAGFDAFSGVRIVAPLAFGVFVMPIDLRFQTLLAERRSR